MIALERLRTGQHRHALASYVQHGRITRSDSREELHVQVATDYLVATADATTPAAMQESVVLASQHVDVDALNDEIRLGLQQQGRLGPDTLVLELPAGPAGFVAGDQVIITRACRDHSGRKILNGTRGQLLAAGPDGLRVQPEDGPNFLLSPDTAVASLRHGYALTIHKAQGVTATTALVVSDGLTRNAAYTALSRGRDRNQLYVHVDDPQTGAPDWPVAFERLCDQLDRRTGDTLANNQVLPVASRLATGRRYEPPYLGASVQGRSVGI